MSVPEQVRKQTKAVQDLYQDLVGDGEPTGAPTTQEKPTAAVPDGSNKDEPQALEPTEPGNNGQDEETYAQKYRTLQGMYNSQVPALNAQVKDLEQRLQQTQQLLATMQQASPAAPAPTATPPQSLLTDVEREEYGDSIDVMRKVSQEMVAPYQTEIDRLKTVIQQMQGHVLPQVEQLSQQQAHSSEQRFWEQLVALVPDWRDINNNQDFQTWLLEIDPLTGMARQTYLDDAQAKLDANRVAGFFTSWVNSTRSTAQPTDPQTPSELERQIAPGRGRATPAPQGGDEKTYTTADITKFYSDVRTGKFKGREEERGRIERDIFAAQAEGRIT